MVETDGDVGAVAMVNVVLRLSFFSGGCTFKCSFSPFLQLIGFPLVKYLIPSLSREMWFRPSVYVLIGFARSHVKKSSRLWSSRTLSCAAEYVNPAHTSQNWRRKGRKIFVILGNVKSWCESSYSLTIIVECLLARILFK